jgi:hypothetical protein
MTNYSDKHSIEVAYDIRDDHLQITVQSSICIGDSYVDAYSFVSIPRDEMLAWLGIIPRNKS